MLCLLFYPLAKAIGAKGKMSKALFLVNTHKYKVSTGTRQILP
jgi:hypothetical protein